MGSKVWIGIRGAEQWIKAPAPRTAFQPVGWSSTTQGRNGRITGRRSRVTHMEYELNWPTVPITEGAKLTEMFYGLAGDGLIHWVDPMVQNALPAHWSFPGLGVTDGAPIYGKVRPTAVATAANNKNLPTVSARFTAISGYTAPRCYIPVPPGYAAHIGVHAANAAATNSIVVAARAGTATVHRLPAIAASSNVRYSTVIQRTTGAAFHGIELRLAPGGVFDGVTLPSTGDIAGIMVEILPVGQVPTGSGFIMGGGNSGCTMFDPPSIIALQAAPHRVPRVSVGARLIEVGP